MAPIFHDVILWRHNYFSVLGKVVGPIKQWRRNFCKKPGIYVDLSCFAFQKIKTECNYLKQFSYKETFKKGGIFQKLGVFDDVSKKWQPFWKKKCHHYVPFINTNTCAKFYGHRTYNSEDIEGGRIGSPGNNLFKKAWLKSRLFEVDVSQNWKKSVPTLAFSNIFLEVLNKI